MAESGNQKFLQQPVAILPRSASIVIIRTEWNASVVDALEEGCLRVLRNGGVKHLKAISVPGAFEIPFAIRHQWQNMPKKKRPHAFIALGCIIRGDTPHFDYVCRAVTDGIVQLNLQLPVPVIFGVLTVDTQLQAQERVGGKHGHKGEEAATTAMKMIALMQPSTTKRS